MTGFTNGFVVNMPTARTYEFFKFGSWYRGLGPDKGIVSKYTSEGWRNSGWWSSVFYEGYFGLITPENWEEITNPIAVEFLELKLLNEL
jgi:hypothetical protein